jgi:hypothetical protein
VALQVDSVWQEDVEAPDRAPAADRKPGHGPPSGPGRKHAGASAAASVEPLVVGDQRGARDQGGRDHREGERVHEL